MAKKKNGNTLQHPGKMEAKPKLKIKKKQKRGEKQTEIEIGRISGKEKGPFSGGHHATRSHSGAERSDGWLSI